MKCNVWNCKEGDGNVDIEPNDEPKEAHRRKHMAMHMRGDLDQEHMWLDDSMAKLGESSQNPS